MTDAKTWTVYVLKSKSTRRHYIGVTSDLEKRLHEHNSGKTKSIAAQRPFEVIYTEEFEDEREAYRREKTLKSYKGGEAFKRLTGL